MDAAFHILVSYNRRIHLKIPHMSPTVCRNYQVHATSILHGKIYNS